MDDRFARLLEQYHDQLRNGGAENSTRENTDEVAAELRQQLEEAEDCLRLIERVRRSQHEAIPLTADPADPARPSKALRFGRFEILKELGRGGHGIVFLAWDPAARRQVALKAPHPDALFTPELRERFLREGIAAARLAHPNIVPVLEVNHAGPVCYIVSPYCKGNSLATLLAEKLAPIALRVAVQWVAALADAIEHAHKHGILHRDLKPANVILEPGPISPAEAEDHFGSKRSAAIDSLVPKVTDFGLAKMLDSQDSSTRTRVMLGMPASVAPEQVDLLDSQGSRTRTGVMLGTPAYMAPEQVDANLGTVGPATDVYALGTILYELLTGRTPFTAESQADLLRQIASGDPRAPRELRPDLPRDLDAVCLRCLQRRPQDRYASAADFAADLRRFLAGQVTLARPLGVARRLLKAARRKPAIAAALIVSAAAAAILAGGVFVHLVQLDRALQIAEDARLDAEKHGRELQNLIYYRDLQAAHRALEDQDARMASSLLKRHPDGASQTPQGFLWRLLWTRTFGKPVRAEAHHGHAHSVDFSADGRCVVSAGADGLVQFREASDLKLRATLRSNVAEVVFACCSPDGTTVAAVESSGAVRLWDAHTQRLGAVLASHVFQAINRVAWSADGQKLAAVGSPGTSLVVWDLPSKEAQILPIGHTDEVNALAYSPDQHWLATGSTDESVCIWDLEHNRQLARFEAGQSHLTCVRFSQDQQYLATAGTKGLVKIWRTADWSPLASYETGADRVDCIAFSPDDAVLTFGDHFGIIREWDWKLDRLRRVLDSQQGRILFVAYSSDGGTYATAAVDGSVCVWNCSADQSADPMALAGGGPTTFAPDSTRLVFEPSLGHVSVFDLRDRSTKFLADLSNESVMGLYFRDSRLLIASGYDVRFLHDLTDQRAPVPLLHSPAPIGCICVTPDEKILFTGDFAPPFHIRAWDFHTGQSLGLLQGHTAAVCELRCSSSDVLASAGMDGTVRLWDVDSRTLKRTLKGHHAAVRSISLSNDNRVLASAGSDRQVRIWDPVSGIASPLVLNHAAPVLAVAFCPDESLLVTGDDNGNIRLWTLPNGEELLVLARLRNKVHSLAFSPDASALVASATYDESRQEIRIWTAPPIGAH